ncbi:MAG: 8-amino-7-oxononanoate synthase [Planctomycetaceae bacterium]|nr:8-amino-7-oxononanoate synthase [Planctomycetaceae bacterium]
MNPRGFRRQLRQVSNVAGNRVLVAERWLLNLASNNYLGLSEDERVQDAAIQAIRRWGTGSGSSPLLSGFTAVHQALADSLGDWKSGACQGDVHAHTNGNQSQVSPIAKSNTRALLFPCGYSANLAALTTLLETDSQVFADRKNHASLLDGLRLAKADRPEMTVRYYRHRNFSDLERLLQSSLPHRPRWIVTDSVFSMDGTCSRPSDLARLAEEYDAQLLVDEAHATGVMGEHGAGLFSFSNLATWPGLWKNGEPRFCVVGTLSKALASIGGFVVGSAEWMERLIQDGRPMIYSTSLPAGAVAAAHMSVQIAREESWRRDKLHQHVTTLHRELTQQGWDTIGDRDAPLLAVVAGDHHAATSLSDALLDFGIWAPAIRPPTVKPLECRVRLSPTATMSDIEIESVVQAFGALAKQLGKDHAHEK